MERGRRIENAVALGIGLLGLEEFIKKDWVDKGLILSYAATLNFKFLIPKILFFQECENFMTHIYGIILSYVDIILRLKNFNSLHGL